MDNLRKLEFAVKAGSAVLRAGGEIYRVEDIVYHMSKSLGLEGVGVFVVPTGMSVSAIGDNGQPMTLIQPRYPISIDLEKIELINDLSRRMASTDISLDVAEAELEKIINSKPYPLLANLIAIAIISGGFSIMFGGGINEGIWGFICGPSVYITARFFKILEVDSFFQNSAGSAVAVFLSLILEKYGLITQTTPFVSGMIMILVPGLAIANAFRDTFKGDFVSGLAKLTEVLVVGSGMGFGAGFVYAISRFF